VLTAVERQLARRTLALAVALLLATILVTWLSRGSSGAQGAETAKAALLDCMERSLPASPIVLGAAALLVAARSTRRGEFRTCEALGISPLRVRLAMLLGVLPVIVLLACLVASGHSGGFAPEVSSPSVARIEGTELGFFAPEQGLRYFPNRPSGQRLEAGEAAPKLATRKVQAAWIPALLIGLYGLTFVLEATRLDARARALSLGVAVLLMLCTTLALQASLPPLAALGPALLHVLWTTLHVHKSNKATA
jgi:hypothetical protein